MLQRGQEESEQTGLAGHVRVFQRNRTHRTYIIARGDLLA
jgi:hypothetical protein